MVRSVLGLTVYLDDPFWAAEGAERLLRSFLADGRSLPFYTTSRLDHWVALGAGESLPDLFRGSDLHLSTRARHLLDVRAADDLDAPSTSFRFLQVAPGSPVPGFLQLTFPLDEDPETLRRLMHAICELGPVLSGSGGFTFTWMPEASGDAFAQMYKLCRRFVGFDLQVPEIAAPYARRFVPSASWLTVVSHRHAGREASLARVERLAAVRLDPFRSCVLVTAGTRPELGDMNRMELPTALRAVSSAFAPLFPDPPAPLPGPFSLGDATARWMKRHFEPEGF